MRTKILIGVLTTLIIIVYINYYNNYKQDYNILQSYLDNINLSLVYEKYPIVIYDQVCQPKTLLPTLFAYSYTFSKEVVIPPKTLVYNHSKHLILWSSEADTIINIINPKYKKNIEWTKRQTLKVATNPIEKLDESIQYITVKLKQHQILILPTFWIFDVNKKINGILLDDLISVFIKYV